MCNRLLLRSFVIFSALLLVGCGSSEDFVATSPQAPETATIQLRSVLARSEVPPDVVSFRGSGFDDSGELLYGPKTVQKDTVADWTDVQLTVKRFVVEYLNAENAVVGLSQSQVILVKGEVFVIENPTILLPEAVYPDLVMGGNQIYTFNTDTGVLQPSIGANSTIPGWRVAEYSLILQSFTLESGSTLELTGSRAFQVVAFGDIEVAGGIDFSGVDGADGSDGNPTGADGEDGEDGSGVTLIALGNLTVTGTIATNGGDGGAGGSVLIAGDNTVDVSAGNGGNGGNAGELILSGRLSKDVSSATLNDSGGAGGAGGDVTIEGTNSGEASSGSGGNGGNPDGAGGASGIVTAGVAP
ncbi:MAG: hypothetical protein WC314_22330 [Vulcanimicrobiota bacterium]